MGKATEISWTDHTFNPWWGCQRVSPGCEHCYAETMAKRWGMDIWGPAKTTERRLFGTKHWLEPLKWDEDAEIAGVRRRVFCASMADVFEDNSALSRERERLWDTIRSTPNLDWLILTKRPENIATMLPGGYWPNIWLGTSTEDQQRADERVPVLLRHRNQVPVLFLSVEPQLGPVALRQDWFQVAAQPIDWIIVGGESGPRHRPFDEAWAINLRDQCHQAGIAFHYKQFGGLHHAAGGCLLDGREHKAFPKPRLEAHAA